MYRKDPIDFYCQRCGLCCEKLFHAVHGIQKSISLTEEEAKQFPSNTIKPERGLGTSITDIRCIISYQVSVEPCPHYDGIENKCNIYQNRPLTCQRFPLVYAGDPFLAGVVEAIDCTFIAETESSKKYKLNGYFTEKNFKAPNCWEALEKEYDHQYDIELLATIDRLNRYRYDLKTNTWHPE